VPTATGLRGAANTTPRWKAQDHDILIGSNGCGGEDDFLRRLVPEPRSSFLECGSVAHALSSRESGGEPGKWFLCPPRYWSVDISSDRCAGLTARSVITAFSERMRNWANQPAFLCWASEDGGFCASLLWPRSICSYKLRNVHVLPVDCAPMSDVCDSPFR
jgi:hypothetical protein